MEGEWAHRGIGKECLPELIKLCKTFLPELIKEKGNVFQSLSKTVDRGLTIYTLYLTGVRLAKSYVCQHLVHHQRLVNFPIKGARMMGQHSTVAHTVHERFACML